MRTGAMRPVPVFSVVAVLCLPMTGCLSSKEFRRSELPVVTVLHNGSEVPSWKREPLGPQTAKELASFRKFLCGWRVGDASKEEALARARLRLPADTQVRIDIRETRAAAFAPDPVGSAMGGLTRGFAAALMLGPLAITGNGDRIGKALEPVEYHSVLHEAAVTVEVAGPDGAWHRFEASGRGKGRVNVAVPREEGDEQRARDEATAQAVGQALRSLAREILADSRLSVPAP